MTGYRTASVLEHGAEGARLDLATALGVTPLGRVEGPEFCSGFVTRPDVVAAGILAVADVAGSRYVDHGQAARLINLDPVVTASGDRLRFESMSACSGVHARFDLLPEGLGSSRVGFGTTNVDVNHPLRTALARVDRAVPLHLSVGSGGLRAATPDATHVERPVDLPDRWVRGLAEVPSLLARMQLAGELRGPAVPAFLAALPRVAPPGPDLHVVPRPAGWRALGSPVPGTFPLPGASRLRGFDRLARHATRLLVHAEPGGSTAWVLEVPGGRLTLALTADAWRGFSGEGQLLQLLARPEAAADGERLLGELGWEPAVDPAALAAATGMGPARTAAGLAWLAASGRLGYDLVEQAWFHRGLPVDAGAVLRRNPRLVSAQALLDGGAVQATGKGRWRVSSGGSDYEVLVAPSRLQCSCPWEDRHHGSRGPCKHGLAVLLHLYG
ncbi:SWIM zinc finger protein [Motilibacter rhizosphaerae]|uniref:SWIM zinc finger protein n=1 Tax=Motilibacter rhizosphaerae TaxID=598652 RepID=A0A4V2F3D3_9ACTN|nr:SWIM zinc finger family protein [Motilibacter rhizosphaerae]RZS82713.1 SWIM zinc finger protein [Motilibacter rhizosphaerae]